MKRIVALAVVIAFAVLGIAGTALAQTKTLTGETQTISATVEAINVTTRTLTMKGPKGNFMDIVVPETVKRFAEIKVGDTLTARYYENLVIRKKLPGEKDVDTSAEGVTPGTRRAGRQGRQPRSGRSPRRSRPSIPRCRRSRSAARTSGPTAPASRTRRCWIRSRSATKSISPGPRRCC